MIGKALPIALFFIQTIALIFKGKGDFSILQMLNLDVTRVARKCMMPMAVFSFDFSSASGMFLFKAFFTPLQLVVFSGTIAVPVWNCLPKKLKQKMQAANQVTWRMWRRCLLNIYLFSYAPVTQACLEMLICHHKSESCSPEADITDPACASYLASDYSIDCESVEFHTAKSISLVILVGVVFVIPGALLYFSKRVVATRTADMELRLTDMSDWFDELDADGKVHINLPLYNTYPDTY